ncbi:hypothetical protein [Shinella zoogloeoides]|uniref:hypothetical protein n=1 Tax=Shinella zoogloeoides TaxID=352475 RepID=UPI000E6505E2|nr:hypothetical protein [Shinella zoogloeoides]
MIAGKRFDFRHRRSTSPALIRLKQMSRGDFAAAPAVEDLPIVEMHAGLYMPLIRKTGAPAPKELGLFWQMLTSEGETIDVFVFAGTLQAFDSSAVGPVGLLKRHRQLLEEIASAKFDREGGIAPGPFQISLDDLRSTNPIGEDGNLQGSGQDSTLRS